MSPPAYPDINKAAREVFTKGYHFGLIKVDVKARTTSGIDLSSSCVSNQDTGKMLGAIESKYKIADQNVTVTGKWNTDNMFTAEVTAQDHISQGLKISADAIFSASGEIGNGHIKMAHAGDPVALNLEVDLNKILTASTVVAHKGLVGGCQFKFGADDSAIKSHSFAVGYGEGDVHLYGFVNNGEDFGGTAVYKISPELDLGFDMTWHSSELKDTHFEVGCKYALDKDACVRARINRAGRLGLGYQQKLGQGITISLSALLDTMKFNQARHKVGIAVELEP